MNWLVRLVRKLVRLAVITATLTAIVIVLDAVLSPDTDEVRPGRLAGLVPPPRGFRGKPGGAAWHAPEAALAQGFEDIAELFRAVDLEEELEHCDPNGHSRGFAVMVDFEDVLPDLGDH